MPSLLWNRLTIEKWSSMIGWSQSSDDFQPIKIASFQGSYSFVRSIPGMVVGCFSVRIFFSLPPKNDIFRKNWLLVARSWTMMNCHLWKTTTTYCWRTERPAVFNLTSLRWLFKMEAFPAGHSADLSVLPIVTKKLKRWSSCKNATYTKDLKREKSWKIISICRI